MTFLKSEVRTEVVDEVALDARAGVLSTPRDVLAAVNEKYPMDAWEGDAPEAIAATMLAALDSAGFQVVKKQATPGARYPSLDS